MMPEWLYRNGAVSVLTEAIDEVASILHIRPQDATKFPVPELDQAFKATIWDGMNYEIVQVDINHLDGSLNVVRGTEDSSPRAFPQGASLRHGVTAEVLTNIPQLQPILDALAGKAELNHNHAIENLENVNIPVPAERPHGATLSWLDGAWRLTLGFSSDIIENISSVPGETVTEALQHINDINLSLGALGEKDQIEEGDIAASAFGEIFDTLLEMMCPAGKVELWPLAAIDIPDGWLLLDGGTHLREEFPVLSAKLVSNPEFEGDGETTFTVPDWRSHVAVGVGTLFSGIASPGAKTGVAEVALTVGQMPSHNHGAGSLQAASHNHNYSFRNQFGSLTSGTIGASDAWRGTSSQSTGNSGPLSVSGSTGNTGSGGAHTNIQPSVAAHWIMKAH